MGKKNSPCIGVCKFKRAGHCIGCSMTKEQKEISKRLKKRHQIDEFISMLISQQAKMGGYRHWQAAFARKKKGAKQDPKINKFFVGYSTCDLSIHAYFSWT